MAKKRVRGKTRVKRTRGRTARGSTRKVRRRAAKRAPARKKPTRGAARKPKAAAPKPSPIGQMLPGVTGVPGPTVPPAGGPVRRDIPWGTRPHSEAEEEFGREEDEEPM